MLDLFKRASKTHVRSESPSHLRDVPGTLAPQDGRFGWDPLLEAPQRGVRSFDADILVQPTLTHQPDVAKPRRPVPEPPPLLTSSEGKETGGHDQNYQTEHQEFAVLPEQSPQQSPTKLQRNSTHIFTGDRTERIKKESSNRVLSCWFNGESEPLNIGILPSPTKQKSEPLFEMSSKPTQIAPKPTLSTRFSLFSTKPSSTKTSSSPSDPADEFLDLDINTALYPTGPADQFSPASFKNHMQHAEGLLSRLQAAYKERTVALHDMTAEKETQAEELDGAETRSKHLKIQLDAMAAKLAEQDKAMMDMVEELANEKRLRREEEDARKRSVKLIKPSGIGPLTPCSPEEGHKLSRQRHRMSSATETDCDSEDESSAESLFSRNNLSSTRISLSSISTTSSPETYQQPDFSGITTAHAARLRQAQPTPIKGQRPPSSSGESVVWSCANCHGVESSEAWNVVSVLKEENQGMKQRVSQMEEAIDGCLEMVDRLL